MTCRRTWTNGLSEKQIASLEAKRQRRVGWWDLDEKSGSVKPSKAKTLPKALHDPVTEETSLETIAELRDLFGPTPDEPLRDFTGNGGLPEGRFTRSGGNRASEGG